MIKAEVLEAFIEQRWWSGATTMSLAHAIIANFDLTPKATSQLQSDRTGGDGLLPCPFCGASVKMHTEGEYCQVICQDCGSKAAEYPNSALAELAWNTRATPPKPAPDALREAVEPFIQIALFISEKTRDGRPIIYALDSSVLDRLTVGHFRKLSALSSAPVQSGGTQPSPQVCEEPRVSFPRWWVQRIRDDLFAVEKPPSGPLGDWAFLFREQLNDALIEQPATAPADGGGAR